MKLCYNSLLLTINNFYDKELSLTDINDMLYRSIDETFGRTCTSEPKENRQKYANELKTGKSDIPKAMKESAKKQTWRQIKDGINRHCKALLSLPNNESLVYVLNQLVINCSNLDANDIIFEEPSIKKLNFAFVKLSIDEYLAKLLHYIFVNAIPVSKVKKTGFDPFHQFTDKDYKTLVDAANKAVSPTIDISSLITVEGETEFNSTFHKLTHPSNLHSKEPNDIKLFYLNTDSDGLNYEGLKECITINLGNYIYSKKHNKELIDAKKYAAIGLQALKDFRKSDVFNGDELGNILLYSFLEFVLKAPKLFSNFEISKSRISSSNAIHIQTVSSQTFSYNMLVFGTSSLEDNFTDAFTKTIDKVCEIKKNEENRYSFVNESIFNSTFDFVEAEKLKSIILPSETRHSFAPAGYAIFVGYKVDVNPEDYATPEELSLAIQSKMKEDIINNLDFIDQTLIDKKLDKRSIYIYVLPFNDPTKDKSSIIDEIVNG